MTAVQLDPAIELLGNLSIPDARTALKLAYESDVPLKVRLASWVVVAVGAFGMYVLLFRRGEVPLFMPLFLVAIPVVVWLVQSVFELRHRSVLRRCHSQRVGLFAPSETILGVEGMSIARDDEVEFIPWKSVFGLRRSERVFVLYRYEGSILVARSRFKNDADWQRASAFIEANVPPLER